MIQSRQKEYYAALGAADAQADSAGFVELMLSIIRDSLTEITVVGRSTDQVSDQDTDQVSDQVSDQVRSPAEALLAVLGEDTLSAVERMERLCLSHRPTFRRNYLNPALEQGRIERTIPASPLTFSPFFRIIEIPIL